MITHVKKNSQKLKTAYIKPSRIESAVHFREQADFPTHTLNHKSSGEKDHYSKERDAQISELNEYIRKIQTMYYSFPYPLF